MTIPALRIVVADDESLVRAGLRLLIENQPDLEVVGEAANGREAIEVVGRTGADVVLMDIRMPLVDGLAAAGHLLAGDRPPFVIMLTTFGEDEYVYEALRIGASGFLLKTAPPESLLDAIRVVAQGHGLIDPAVTMRVIEAFAQRSPARESHEALSSLTPRELEVLRLIARGLNNSEIAQELVVSQATVKTHVNRILMKLHLRDRTQAVVLAYEAGVVQIGV